MKTRMTQLALALVCTCAQAVQAETLEWRIAAAGNWSDSFWIEEPNDLQFPWLWPVYESTNIRRVWPALGLLNTTVTIDASTFPFGAAVTDDLYVNNNGSGADVAVDLNSGGALTTDHTSVGYPASGEFNQSGGLHQTGQLFVGEGRGVYRLSGQGQLTASIVEIGHYGEGVFQQSGGTHTVSTRLVMGHLAYSVAVYELTGGTLTVPTEVIAGSGRAGFYQGGGSHTVTESLTLGKAGPSPGAPPTEGIYELGAGALATSAVEVRRGDFSQSGGIHTMSGILTLGDQGSLDATYTLSGGVLTVAGIRNGTVQGNQLNGISYLNIDGGVLNLTGTTIALDTFNIGNAPGSNGSLTLPSGKVLTAENETIGVEGNGTLVQSGGTHTVTFDLTLGEKAGAHGDYTLAGGVLNVDTLANGIGTGTFTHTGGTNNVNALVVAPNGSSYALQAGRLNAGSITANGASAFDFTGGTLSVDVFNGNLLNNGGTLSPGDSPGVTRVVGNYSESAGGMMTVELGGTGAGMYDVLVVDGAASLAGRLDVVFFNGFSPVEGDTFDIVRTVTLNGKFRTTDLPPLNPDLRWLVNYIVDSGIGFDSVRLTVVPAVSADFDRDGDVDLHDLDMFKRCASAPAVPYDRKCTASAQDMDFDDDSDIDLVDFGAFQRCYSGEGVAGDPTCAG